MVRLIVRRSVLPAVCVGLAWFGAGCDTSSVNESGSTGASASAKAAPAKDAPPPPTSIKDYYERQKGGKASPTTPTTKGATE